MVNGYSNCSHHYSGSLERFFGNRPPSCIRFSPAGSVPLLMVTTMSFAPTTITHGSIDEWEEKHPKCHSPYTEIKTDKNRVYV